MKYTGQGVYTNDQMIKMMQDNNFDVQKAKIKMNRKILSDEYFDIFHKKPTLSQDEKDYENDNKQMKRAIDEYKGFCENPNLIKVLQQLSEHDDLQHEPKDYYE